MARTLLCEIVTPESILYTNEVQMVVATTPDGEVGILPLHAPIVTTLAPGEVRLRFGDGAADWEYFSISGGYLQVHEDKVIVLADAAVAVSQIDAARAKESAELIEARLAELPADAEERARRDDSRPELARDPAQGRREARRQELAARARLALPGAGSRQRGSAPDAAAARSRTDDGSRAIAGSRVCSHAWNPSLFAAVGRCPAKSALKARRTRRSSSWPRHSSPGVIAHHQRARHRRRRGHVRGAGGARRRRDAHRSLADGRRDQRSPASRRPTRWSRRCARRSRCWARSSPATARPASPCRAAATSARARSTCTSAGLPSSASRFARARLHRRLRARRRPARGSRHARLPERGRDREPAHGRGRRQGHDRDRERRA